MKEKRRTILQHPTKPERRIKIKEGIAWGVFAFGLLALAFRKQWREVFIIAIAITAIVLVIPYTRISGSFVTHMFNAGWMSYAMFANESFKKRLLKSGWTIVGYEVNGKFESAEIVEAKPIEVPVDTVDALEEVLEDVEMSTDEISELESNF